MTRFSVFLLLFTFLLIGICQSDESAARWRIAEPGWLYQFPRDHRPHPEFKTEWWYFTGELRTDAGDRFGFQITFFRQGVRPRENNKPGESRLIVNDVLFGHAALTDVKDGRFRFAQKSARGSFGEAGIGDEPNSGKIVWLPLWELSLDAAGNFGAVVQIEDAHLALRFEAQKPWAVHGSEGISQKAAGKGRASHYYSGTRLAASGTVRLGDRTLPVRGESWFDHEWATNQLTPEQSGWDWMSLQLNDGTELMLYQMRLRDGGIDPHSSGTFVEADGQVIHLRRDEYQIQPLRTWKSPRTGASYPVSWRVRVPRFGIVFDVNASLSHQELVLDPISYWEGIVDVSGTREGAAVQGHGYVELTGYAGALVGLSATPASPPPSP